METRNNKTIMSSVFFLDIVEYSKESVVGQISLKDRFNEMLANALKDVPDADRIILDTGDGAAVSFIGDIEEALHAAFGLRQAILAQDVNLEPILRVRMGINLGPVRLVRDINGQPNIVGDGINVAQRIMAFADINQILLSRSYYDAVSRLSPQYAGMFRYKGSHTDKHVREHEVYAISVPGEETIQTEVLTTKESATTSKRSKIPLLAGISVALAAAGWYISKPTVEPILPITNNTPISSVLPASTVANVSAVLSAKPNMNVSAVTNTNATSSVRKTEKAGRDKRVYTPPAASSAVPNTTPSEGNVTIDCAAGTHIYMDGTSKGKIGTGSMTLTATPGGHSIILNTSSGIITHKFEIKAGESIRVSPAGCN